MAKDGYHIHAPGGGREPLPWCGGCPTCGCVFNCADRHVLQTHKGHTARCPHCGARVDVRKSPVGEK